MLVAEEHHHYQILPPTETLVHVLGKYVDNVHPQLPFLNLEGFSGNIQAAVARGHLSLFVLVTMLAAAFPHADDIFAVMAGFQSSKEASMSYFDIAEVMHRQEIEQDPIAVASGFLLLSTCAGSQTTDYYQQKYRCIMKAKHFLQLTNIHLNADDNSTPPAKNAKMKRRLAWCCFAQERIIAMSAMSLKPLLPTEKSVLQARMICNGDFQFRPILTTYYGLQSQLLQDTLAQMCVAYLFKLRIYVCCYLMGQLPAQLHRDKQIWKGLEAQIIAWYTSFLDMFKSHAILPSVQRCLIIQWESLVLLYQTVKLQSLHDSWSAANVRAHGLSWARSTFQDAVATWETMKKVFANLKDKQRLCCIPGGGVSLIYPAVLCISRLRELPYAGIPNTDSFGKDDQLMSLLDSLRERFSGVDAVLAFIRQGAATEQERLAEELSLPTPQSEAPESHAGSDCAEGTVRLSEVEIRPIRRPRADQALPQASHL